MKRYIIGVMLLCGLLVSAMAWEWKVSDLTATEDAAGYWILGVDTGPDTDGIVFLSTSTNSAEPVWADISTGGTGSNDFWINLGTSSQPTWITQDGQLQLQFDGVDDTAYRTIASIPAWRQTTNGMTHILTLNIRGWNTAQENNVFSQTSTGDGVGGISDAQWAFFYRSNVADRGELRLRIYLNGGDGGVGSAQINSGYDMSTGVYYRVAFTYDMADLVMFANGATISTCSAASGSLYYKGPFSLGAPATNTVGYGANCWITDVRVYTNVLSPAEILTEYNEYDFWN